MSQALNQREVLQALTGETALTPEGTAKVQESGKSVYIAIPVELADHHELEQGDELNRGIMLNPKRYS